MSEIVIPEEEIRETFYNLMLEVAVVKDALKSPVTRDHTIQSMIVGSIQTICELSSEQGFPTMRGHVITCDNVGDNFKEMFSYLGQIRQIVDPSRKNQAIVQLVKVIIQKNTFKSIINNLVRFYLESVDIGKIKRDVTIQTIRESFYNSMVDEVFSTGLIRKEHLDDQDAFIFFALSSLAILSSVKSSGQNSGIWLHNGAIVTEANCPPSYQPLFKHLILIKRKYISMNLTDDQLQLVRICAINDPEMTIPEQLKPFQNPELMSLVTIITDLAINISSIQHFKEVLNDVIKYCIEAFGT